jgi:AraC-like DNA-binding protein
MKYSITEPSEVLKPYVRYFWSLQSNDAAGSERAFRTIADGCPGFLFQSREEGKFSRDGKNLPSAFLFGQSTTHGKLDLSGELSATGICFYPQALKVIFGFNAELLTDGCMDLGDLEKQEGSALICQLSETPLREKRIEVLNRFLISQIKQHHSSDHRVMDYALGLIVHSKGAISIAALCEKVHLTERTLERRFKEYVGMTPKLFARICQFQSSLKQFQTNTYQNFSDIAFANAYADQSHFIRSFKQFAGLSPNQLYKQPAAVIDNFSEIKA